MERMIVQGDVIIIAVQMANSLQFYKRARKEYETNRPLGYQFSLTKIDNRCKKFLIILGKFIEALKSGLKENYLYEVEEFDNYWEELQKHFAHLTEMKYIIHKIYEGKEIKLRLLFMLLLNNKKLFSFITDVITQLPHLYANPHEKLNNIDAELEPVSFFKDGQFKIFTVTPNYIEEFKAFWEEEETNKLLFLKQIKEVLNEMVEKVEKRVAQIQQREQQEKDQKEEAIRKQKLKEEKEREQLQKEKELMQKEREQMLKGKEQTQKDRKPRPNQTAFNETTQNITKKSQPEPPYISQPPSRNANQFPSNQPSNQFTPYGKDQLFRSPQTPDPRLLQKKPRNLKNSEYLYQMRYKDQLQSYQNNTLPYSFEFSISEEKSKCTECGKQLSRGLIIIGSDMNLCNYSGRWFCNDCMSGQRIQIPHKAKFEFDLRSYQVSKQAYERIRFYYQRPIIEFRHDEPVVLDSRKLYDFLVLKRQIHLMYDSICNPDFMNKTFAKKINYALKRNLFSLKNLYDIYNGHEHQQIQKDFAILQRHFYKCEICQSRKGRLCYACSNPPRIFAFELLSTYSCKHCHKIYHRRCLIGNKCACETSTLR